jgi:hypothetical protein
VLSLRTMIDFSQKNWEWDITINSVKRYINRTVGNNFNGSNDITNSAEESSMWESKELNSIYTEGSILDDYHIVEFDQSVGTFGGLRFKPGYIPTIGDVIVVSFRESPYMWVGSGGLMHQLATDLCVHPYDVPEMRVITSDHYDLTLVEVSAGSFVTGVEYTISVAGDTDFTLIGSSDSSVGTVFIATGIGAGTGVVTQPEEKFIVGLNKFGFLDDVPADTGENGPSTQRQVKNNGTYDYGLWRVVRTDNYTFKTKIDPTTGLLMNLGESVHPEFPDTLTRMVHTGGGGGGTYSGGSEGSPAQPPENVQAGNFITGVVYMIFFTHDFVGGEITDFTDIGAADNNMYTTFTATGPGTGTGYAVSSGTESIPGIPPTYSDGFCYIPYLKSDLGNGKFVLTLDGRVLPDKFWYSKSTSFRGLVPEAKRYTQFYFVGDVSTDIPWVSDPLNCKVDILFQWEYSTLKPYGALVGPHGFSPEQELIFDGDWSFRGDNLWSYTAPTIDSTGLLTITDFIHFSVNDILLLEYKVFDGLGFNPAFNLIYPSTDNNNKSTVEMSCDQISNMFVVESTGAVDLLSMESQYGLTQHLPGGLKSQKWRIRFEWLEETNELKVNVATKYQLKDDGTVTHGHSRDGIKQSVYRLPGELCDIYHEPVRSRHIKTTSVKNKSHWFKRQGSKQKGDIRDTYPMSYRLTTTNHGVSLFLWEHASVSSDTDSSWFVVQRHVDQTSGQPDLSGKTPLHCVYSPSKRVTTFEGLQQYYSSADVFDLSPAPIIYDATGDSLMNPSKTYWISNDSVFDGNVNAIDFFGKGYGSTTVQGAHPTYPAISDFNIGVIPTTTFSGYGAYWSDNTSSTVITSLHIQGFMDLPRKYTNNTWVFNALANDETVEKVNFVPANLSMSSISYSGNMIFTTLTPERMSLYGDISSSSGSCLDTFGAYVTLPSSNGNSNNKEGCIAEGRSVEGWTSESMDYTWMEPQVPSAETGATTSDWKTLGHSLIDILSPHNTGKRSEIMESLLVSINEISVERDINAYILSYNEWYNDGDPSTVDKFLESLDAAGVNTFGDRFKLPMFSHNDAGDALFDEVGSLISTANAGWSSIVGSSSVLGSCQQQGLFFNHQSTDIINTRLTGNQIFSNVDLNNLGGSNFVKSNHKTELYDKLPGDVIFTDKGDHNNYFYDFENKTLHFKKAPSRGVKLSISFDSFAQTEGYLIKTIEDKDFPHMEEDAYVNINRFVVRESDVLKPWDYHLSATKHSIDSYAIINPYEQLSITDDRNFVFSFPTQLTTQRFYYPTSELDMICISSAGFSSQGGHIEIDKYADSTGEQTTVYTEGNNTFNPTSIETSADGIGVGLIYSGQVDQLGEKYYWKRNIRKYEGMTSTLPNGNGMRVFVLVTGTSIRHSDIEKRTII